MFEHSYWLYIDLINIIWTIWYNNRSLLSEPFGKYTSRIDIDKQSITSFIIITTSIQIYLFKYPQVISTFINHIQCLFFQNLSKPQYLIHLQTVLIDHQNSLVWLVKLIQSFRKPFVKLILQFHYFFEMLSILFGVLESAFITYIFINFRTFL